MSDHQHKWDMSNYQHEWITHSVAQTTSDLRNEYPMLWRMSEQFDVAERLGGCTDPLLAEIDMAMRELWTARERAHADDRVNQHDPDKETT